jgi:hypothetical protein
MELVMQYQRELQIDIAERAGFGALEVPFEMCGTPELKG